MEKMENSVIVDGILTGFEIKDSGKLAIGQIKNIQTSNGINYENNFDVNFWSESITKLKDLPFGSIIKVEGRLKNDEYTYDGRQIKKMKLNCTKCSVLQKFALPTAHPTTYESVNEIPF